jgi:uncharacterized protein YqhQ
MKNFTQRPRCCSSFLLRFLVLFVFILCLVLNVARVFGLSGLDYPCSNVYEIVNLVLSRVSFSQKLNVHCLDEYIL